MMSMLPPRGFPPAFAKPALVPALKAPAALYAPPAFICGYCARPWAKAMAAGHAAPSGKPCAGWRVRACSAAAA